MGMAPLYVNIVSKWLCLGPMSMERAPCVLCLQYEAQVAAARIRWLPPKVLRSIPGPSWYPSIPGHGCLRYLQLSAAVMR